MSINASGIPSWKTAERPSSLSMNACIGCPVQKQLARNSTYNILHNMCCHQGCKEGERPQDCTKWWQKRRRASIQVSRAGQGGVRLLHAPSLTTGLALGHRPNCRTVCGDKIQSLQISLQGGDTNHDPDDGQSVQDSAQWQADTQGYRPGHVQGCKDR